MRVYVKPASQNEHVKRSFIISFRQFRIKHDTVKMLRSGLLLLTLCLLKNEVKCGGLGKITKYHESLMPRAKIELPTNASQLNTKISSLHKILMNTTSKINQAGNLTTNRHAKFFPKFELLAGLNVGGGLSTSNLANLAGLAKISEASSPSIPGIVSPFIAATYDPYPYVPASYNVQQSITALHRLLESIKLQLETKENSRNSSVLTTDDNEVDMIDDRKRRKDKLRTKNKATAKKRKEQIRDEDEFYDENMNMEMEYRPTGPTQRQALPEFTTTTTISPIITTAEPNMTASGNQTYPNYPGYWGGQPQSISNVLLTNDLPRDDYGPPFSGSGTSNLPSGSPLQSYGLPAPSYGLPAPSYGLPAPSYGPPAPLYGPPAPSYGSPAPSYDSPAPSYGQPSQSYGSTSQVYNPPIQVSNQPVYSYGVPSYSYGSPSNGYPPYSPYQPHETILYEEPASNSFGSTGQPIGRSRNFLTTTHLPPIGNSLNGFVPV